MSKLVRFITGSVAASAIAVGVWLLSIPVAGAWSIAVFPADPTAGGGDLVAWINRILGILVSVAGVVFMLMLVFGGFKYLTSAGNEEEVGKAKKIMIDATIGLVITLMAWAIGSFVVKQLGGWNIGF